MTTTNNFKTGEPVYVDNLANSPSPAICSTMKYLGEVKLHRVYSEYFGEVYLPDDCNLKSLKERFK